VNNPTPPEEGASSRVGMLPEPRASYPDQLHDDEGDHHCPVFHVAPYGVVPMMILFPAGFGIMLCRFMSSALHMRMHP